jgi:hypothetical protein
MSRKTSEQKQWRKVVVENVDLSNKNHVLLDVINKLTIFAKAKMNPQDFKDYLSILGITNESSHSIRK